MTEKLIFKRHPLVLAVFAALNIIPVAHAVSTDLVISQVYGGGGNTGSTYKNDFIELFNRGTAPVNLNGMSVQYASSAGTTWQKTNLTDITLQPGQYYLVQQALGAGGTINLPTADGIGTIAISGTTGKVALVSNQIALTGSNPTTGVVDFIGFGAANFSETSPTPALSNTTADLRNSNGCTDTDNNSTDFTIGAPAPRNTLTALNACSVTTPTVNLSVSSNAGSETGTTVITVTATAASTVTSDQTVTLGVTGTGITAGDFNLSNTTITILAGQSTGTATFTVVDDALAEGTETAVLAIASPSAGITLGATTSQNITITDNEVASFPAVNLSVSSNTGTEAASTVITVTATASSAVTGNQTVNLAVSGTDITAGDYALSSTTITIPNNGTTGSVTFTIINDTAVESTETASLAISNPSAGLTLGATLSQAITITDNDVAGNACGDPASKISAVQGSGAVTALSASTTVEAIVVGDYQGISTNSLRGFFVQEEDADADGNPATSEGVFVYEGAAPLATVNVGDKVRITGTPGEAFGTTQLTATGLQVCATNQTIPTAATLTLPVPNVPNDSLANATAAIDKYYESFEGMLVKIPTTLKVSEYFELERYGQLVLSQGGRIPTFTSVSNPGTAGLLNQQITLAKRQIVLDDGIDAQNFYTSNPTIPLPFPTGGLSITNSFRGGDTIDNLTGVLQYAFSQWRIRSVEELADYTFIKANPRKPVSPVVGGTLNVASFNVLNYFTTIDTTSSSTAGPCSPDGTQDCRGADSAAELTRQTAKAAAALCGINADIVGLMEIENNATASLSSLVTAANAIIGCGPYASINTGTIGTDAIKVGLLYKTSTVSPVGSHALLTTNVDARFIDTKNRPTLAQTFSQAVGGEKLTVAVNHLKSKGSSCTEPDALDGQGNCNLTRRDAALAMVDWLHNDPTNSGDPDYLIIGDLNSYAKEDPIKAIENGPDNLANTADDYTNLVKAFGGAMAYSYVFDGQTGYLDHALANSTLLPQVTGTEDWHINADETPSMDYNDTIKDVGEAAFEAKPAALPLYAANQYRTSDHDPVIIGLHLGENINIIEGTSARNTLVGTAAKDRITGLGGIDNLTGGANADEFVYVTTADGIDTITDFTVGTDKIVLAALLQSLGYQGANPLVDGIVKFAASGANTLVYIDADGTGPAVQRALIVVNNVSVANLNNAANFIF